MFDIRLRKLKEQIKKEKLDGVFISNVSNISYLSGFSNFSKDEREAHLLVGENFAYIITDGRYTEAVKKEVKNFSVFERGGTKSTEDLFKKLASKIKSLGIEEDNLTVSEYKIVNKHFKKLKHFNLGKLRAVKQKEELEKIKRASELGDGAFKYILSRAKLGVSEKELSRELEKYIKEKGGEFSFPAIVAFGKNSSVPHHQTGNTKLKDGDLVLIDMGAKVEGYSSDMTRVIFLGKPTQKQKEIYNVVLEAQQKAVEFLNSKIQAGKKVTGGEVDKIARDYIIKKRYSSIPHSLGHGIGLEVHEQPYLSPKSEEALKEGMVFSIEPGIYIEGFGGVRIEDLYVITKDGLKQLTNAPSHPI